MAKSGAADVASSRSAMELKRELRRLVKAIVEEDDQTAETYEEAINALLALKDLASNGSNGNGNNNGGGRKKIPEHFLCPISSEIMKDPVVLSSGQTYDRPYIEQWLNSGNRTCPKTQQVLVSLVLTPNQLIRGMIFQWCSEHAMALPPLSSNNNSLDGGTLVTADERSQLSSLVRMLSSPTLPEKKQAAKELRLRTRKSSFRSLIAQNPEAIPLLLSILSSPTPDADLQEDAVTAILNVSIEDSNKKLIGNSKEAVVLLVDALATGINMQTRGNAAAALFTLSALDSNKIRIVKLGAMRPLVDLLECGSPLARRDAGSAIFNLCTVRENRAVAAREGVAGVSLRMIENGLLVAESLALLALLSSYEEVAEELAENGGVDCLLRIVGKSLCARDKENAVAILYSVCVDHRRKLKEVREEENANGTLSELELAGTSRARRKADGLLNLLRKTAHNTHYSC